MSLGFLYYVLATLKLASLDKSTAIPGLNRNDVYELFIPLAPSPEQHRIVAKIEELFTKLDAGVQALKKAKAKLKRYRQSVLKAAVEGELTREWREAHKGESEVGSVGLEPAAKLLERILKERRARWEAEQLVKMLANGKPPKNDEWKKKYKEPAAPDTSGLPELPEWWVWARAEQLCGFITKGTTPTADKLRSKVGEIPFIKVYNLTFDGRLDFSINPTFIDKQTHNGELARSRVIPGDVLLNIVGPPMGKVSVVPELHAEWNLNQAIAIFRSIGGCEGKFLAFSLLTDHVLAWAIERAKATAGQYNLTLEICRDLPLPLPPESEQRALVAEVERRLSIADGVEAVIDANLKRAERLRQSILKQAFSGKLVQQDPTDEPASVLLERIREEKLRRSANRPSGRRKQPLDSCPQQ